MEKYEQRHPLLQNVSRETFLALQAYAEMVLKWTPKINLISPGSQGSVWERHIIDSAQLFPLIGSEATILDVGSGGGFPGIVLSIMGVKQTYLVESDARKATFLELAATHSRQNIDVMHKRVESIPPFAVDYITARAVASVTQLLAWTQTWHEYVPNLLFLKGKMAQEELDEAAQKWEFSVKKIPNANHPEGVILHLTHVKKKR